MHTKKVIIEGKPYELRKGDITLASALVGCSMDIIRRMLLPEDSPQYRNPGTETGERVMAALKEIVKQRTALKVMFNRELAA